MDVVRAREVSLRDTMEEWGVEGGREGGGTRTSPSAVLARERGEGGEGGEKWRQAPPSKLATGVVGGRGGGGGGGGGGRGRRDPTPKLRSPVNQIRDHTQVLANVQIYPPQEEDRTHWAYGHAHQGGGHAHQMQDQGEKDSLPVSPQSVKTLRAKVGGQPRRKSHEISRPKKQTLNTVNFNPHLSHSTPHTPVLLFSPKAVKRTLNASRSNPQTPYKKPPSQKQDPNSPSLLSISTSPFTSRSSSSLTPHPPTTTPNLQRTLSTGHLGPEKPPLTGPPGLPQRSTRLVQRKTSQGARGAEEGGGAKGRVGDHPTLVACSTLKLMARELEKNRGRVKREDTQGFVVTGTDCRTLSGKERGAKSEEDEVWRQKSAVVSERESVTVAGEWDGEREEEEEEEEGVEPEAEEGGAKNVDSLVQLLYSEIAETLEEQTDSKTSLWAAGGEGSEVTLLPDVLQKIHTAVVMENMQKRTGEVPPATYGEHSILIPPPDSKTLMKAGEFRGKAIMSDTFS